MKYFLKLMYIQDGFMHLEDRRGEEYTIKEPSMGFIQDEYHYFFKVKCDSFFIGTDGKKWLTDCIILKFPARHLVN